ncbi:MAG: hypothetical protein JNM93_12460 [Bacteriovoracaceae bacterium]|nr:hypothetical protein [Bacteriovoracaceae bacterium]
MSKLNLIYSGSVKDIYQSTENNHLFFEFSDRYSVFDWGQMPDLIEGKGEALAFMGKFFFDYLSKSSTFKNIQKPEALSDTNWEKMLSTSAMKRLEAKGMKSHFISQDKNRLEVLAVQVLRPSFEIQNDTKKWKYDYTSATTDALVPLEVIFRFGMPNGSSLVKRLEKNYLDEIGLEKQPKENTLFENVVIEFSTKLEPVDRYLTYTEAKSIAGLNEAEFSDLINTTKLLAVALQNLFAQLEIDLWDGKFEFAFGKSREFILVDSIGIDELRLISRGKHLSKEFLRQYYRDSSWYKASEEAKKAAAKNPRLDWKQYCVNELGEKPQKLDSVHYQKAKDLYCSLCNEIALSLEQRPPFKDVTAFDLFLKNF